MKNNTGRRHRAVAAACILVTGFLAACGSDDGGASTADSTTPRAAAGVDDSVGDDSVVDDSVAEESQPRIVVSMGDSFIAGTAGRWAGNSNGYTTIPRNMDAFRRSDTGENAYDNYGQPNIDNCFRSRSAEIHLGEPWVSRNIACSGAKTGTVAKDKFGFFKPGIDDDGQLAFLREVAANGDVAMIVLSIGGNDFAFGPVLKACAQSFLTSSLALPSYCSEKPKVTGMVDEAAAVDVRPAIATSIEKIVSTMRDLGYDDTEWDMIVQNYPNPLPPASAMRYGQLSYKRQSTGGCPFYDRDLDWVPSVVNIVNTTVAQAIDDARAATGRDIVAMDVSGLFEGRRLCEKGAKLVEETANADEQLRYAERFEQIRLTSLIKGTPYSVFEGLHPNHYGQLALRACLRQVFNEGDARSGSCAPPADWGVADERGEPAVGFSAQQ